MSLLNPLRKMEKNNGKQKQTRKDETNKRSREVAKKRRYLQE
jgi:hypothetical protein